MEWRSEDSDRPHDEALTLSNLLIGQSKREGTQLKEVRLFFEYLVPHRDGCPQYFPGERRLP